MQMEIGTPADPFPARDLIFNNLIGQIPDSLFNLSSLSILFLGNNKLNGALSESKSSSLLNVDLSYNNLVGSIPSWVNGTSLQLNLVANNFTLDSSNSSFDSGSHCQSNDLLAVSSYGFPDLLTCYVCFSPILVIIMHDFVYEAVKGQLWRLRDPQGKPPGVIQ